MTILLNVYFFRCEIEKGGGKYYLDKRIGSDTIGELYDRYPSDEGAVMLNKDEFEFILN